MADFIQNQSLNLAAFIDAGETTLDIASADVNLLVLSQAIVSSANFEISDAGHLIIAFGDGTIITLENFRQASSTVEVEVESLPEPLSAEVFEAQFASASSLTPAAGDDDSGVISSGNRAPLDINIENLSDVIDRADIIDPLNTETPEFTLNSAVDDFFQLAGVSGGANSAPVMEFSNSVTGGLSLNENGRTGDVARLANFDMPTNALTIEMAFTSDTLPADMGANGTVLASYAVSGTDNEFLIFAQSNGKLGVYINGKVTQLDVDANSLFDGTPKHLAVTFDSASGQIQAFVNGTLEAAGTTNAAPIQSGGSLTLGQEQDSVGGGYVDAQAFSGEFHSFQVFDAVRSNTDIAESARDLDVDGNAPNLVSGFTFTGDTPLTDTADETTFDVQGGQFNAKVVTENSTITVTLQDGEGNNNGLILNEGADTGELALISNANMPTEALTAEISFKSTEPPVRGETNGTVLISYAVPGTHNEFLIFAQSNGKLGIYVNGKVTQLDIDSQALFNGEEQHLAVSLDSATGQIQAFVNGVLEATGTTKAGKPLQSGGTITLGQEQDTVGGGFKANQEFEGTIYNLSIFEGVRTASEIAESAEGTFPSQDPSLALGYNFEGTTPTTDVTGNTEISITGGATVQSGIQDGAFVADFNATDSDGDPLTFSIASGNEDGAFKIDPATGTVTIANVSLLDVTTKPVHQLEIQVRDGKGGLDTGTLVVNLNAAPTSAQQSFTANEDNVFSDNLVASDLNTDQDLSFALVEGPAKGSVTLNTDGSFEFNPGNDFQSLQQGQSDTISFKYEVRDGNGGIVIQTATVRVEGRNDAPTDIDPNTASVNENAAGGTVVATLATTDVDAGDTFQFEIVNNSTAPISEALAANPGQSFSLDYNGSGNVILTSLGVLKDGGDTTHTVWRMRNPTDSTLEVQLDPVGGNTATRTFTLEPNSDTIVASEGLNTHKLLDSSGNQIQVKAAGNQTFSWSTEVPIENVEPVFEIVNGQLVVREGVTLNYEDQTSHDVTIKVTDNAGSTYTETITVAVNNVNEPPVLTFDTSTIGETETQLGKTTDFTGGESTGRIGDFITATGVDSNGQEAALRTNNRDGLGLSGGRIRNQINYDPASQTSQKVVLDMDSPVTNITLTVERLIENEFPGGEQGKWTALDANGNEIATGNLSPATADVRFSRSSFAFELDTLNKPISSLVIEAIDVTGRNRGDNSDFTIKSIKYDKLPASFEASEGLVATLPNDLAEGAILASFSATDPDAGDVLSYSISEGNEDGAFAIDATTGVLTINTPDNITLSDGFARQLTIEVADGNGGIDTQDMFITRGQGGNDTFTGTNGDDIILGGLGNDILDGAAGADSLYGGAGNDTITFDALDNIISGGSGADTLKVQGTETIDLSIYASKISDIETINLENGLGNTVTVTADDVFSISSGNQLFIQGDAGVDNVNISGLESAGVTDINGTSYQQFNGVDSDATLYVNLGVNVTNTDTLVS